MEEETKTPTCGTCKHYHKEVRDNNVTGAAFDARTCNHPRYRNVIGKCPPPDFPGCLLHSQFQEEVADHRNNLGPPYLGMFDDKVRGALNLHSLAWQFNQYVNEFVNKFVQAENDYSFNPMHGMKDTFSYRLGYALMNTDSNMLRTEFYNVVNDSLEAYLEPAFGEAQIGVMAHIDLILEQIEERYAPLQQELEELRREVKRLQDENSDSFGPALRAAVED